MIEIDGRCLVRAVGAGLVQLALVAAGAVRPAAAEGPGFQDPLLDRFTGEWVLEGTIAGDEVTHDLSAEWVLGHHYLRFHEVAREKEADGSPAYVATVYIGWEPGSERYVCLWLDTTGGTGLNPDGFGYARRDGDALPFLWEGGDDGVVFHTTFSYDRASDTWRWTMDSERDGEFRPFARLTMRRPEPAGDSG